MDLITWLRALDPWPFLAGLFLILWVVEAKFGGRAKATRQQVMEAKLAGYDLAAKDHFRYIGVRAKQELEEEEFAE